MLVEAYVALDKGMLSQEDCDEIQSVIRPIFGKVKMDQLDDQVLLTLISHDKKNQGKSLNFTLLKEIGKAVIDCEVAESEIVNALNKYRRLK